MGRGPMTDSGIEAGEGRVPGGVAGVPGSGAGPGVAEAPRASGPASLDVTPAGPVPVSPAAGVPASPATAVPGVESEQTGVKRLPSPLDLASAGRGPASPA